MPSGGGKWLLEAPYLMQAANDLKVHLGWAVQVYNAAEALPNLINPFWMLPLLGVLGLRARNIVGFTFLQLIVHAAADLVPAVGFRLHAALSPASDPDLALSTTTGREPTLDFLLAFGVKPPHLRNVFSRRQAGLVAETLHLESRGGAGEVEMFDPARLAVR